MESFGVYVSKRDLQEAKAKDFVDPWGDKPSFEDYPMTFKRLPKEYWDKPPEDLPTWAYVNPQKVTKYDRTDAELEAFLLFSMFVAGKSSDDIKQRLWRVLHFGKSTHTSPVETFKWLIQNNMLVDAIKATSIGKYNLFKDALYRLTKDIDSGKLDLRTVTRDELVQYPGIGMKSASFFIAHSREDEQHAIMDVHILKWMKRVTELLRQAHGDKILQQIGCYDVAKGQPYNIPKQSPVPNTYKKLEPCWFALFDIAKEYGYTDPTLLDLEIWKASMRKQLDMAPVVRELLQLNQQLKDRERKPKQPPEEILRPPRGPESLYQAKEKGWLDIE